MGELMTMRTSRRGTHRTDRSKPRLLLRGIAAAGGLAAVALASTVSPNASAEPTTEGTWTFHGPQTSTETTTTTTGTAYSSAVRAPINASGLSNFPAKRGVIPVQFDLLAATTTTTTTTTTYDPPEWKSLLDEEESWSYATFCLVPGCTAPGALTFADITNLSAEYLFTEGDCRTGSLRWTIYVDHGGVEKSIHVYYGTPNGPDQGCSGPNSSSGLNMISTSMFPDRFEMQGGWGVPGPVYTTYADAFASTNGGTDRVIGAQLTLDSGFSGDQRANISNVTVNDNTWVPKTTESTDSTVTGDYAKTCTLPEAKLRWAKNDNSATGAVNEAESIQPKDTGQFYRRVDCKYIYNLDVSSLDGKGTYTVWVNIAGTNVETPAKFDLR